MSTFTKYKKLEKPIALERYSIDIVNKNSDIIDSELHKLELKNESQDTLLATKEALNAEISRAVAKENNIESSLNSEISRAQSAEYQISRDLENEINRATSDMRLLISGLTARLNALADSDDTTLDQLSEIVAYIKNNKDLIDGITTSKVNVSDIIDDLTSNSGDKVLSAKQGTVLKGLITDLTEIVGNKVDKVSGKGLSTNDFTNEDKNKLNGIASDAEVNVQADWNVTDPTSDAFIKNKPDINNIANNVYGVNGGKVYNADRLDGYHASESADGDTIVKRNSAGYVYATYLNQASSNNENPAISQFFVQNGSDNYLRKASVEHVKATLGISSNADTVDGYHASDLIRSDGGDINSGSIRLNGNTYLQVWRTGTIIAGFGGNGSKGINVYVDNWDTQEHINQRIELGYSSTNKEYRICAGDNVYNLGSYYRRWKNIYSATSVSVRSDRNSKKDIKTLDEERTKRFIMGLIPSEYKFIDGTSGRVHYGMIAQDVEELLKELGMTSMDFAGFMKNNKTICSHKKGNAPSSVDETIEVVPEEYIYGLRYEEFIAPTIKMVQIQQKEINTLTEKLQRQQEQIDMLMQRLESL